MRRRTGTSRLSSSVRKGSLRSCGIKERTGPAGTSSPSSMTMCCSRHSGWLELLKRLVGLKELAVSQARQSFRTLTRLSGISSVSRPSKVYTTSVSWESKRGCQAISPLPVHGQPGRFVKLATTKGKSSSSKRATCRGGRKRSGR